MKLFLAATLFLVCAAAHSQASSQGRITASWWTLGRPPLPGLPSATIAASNTSYKRWYLVAVDPNPDATVDLVVDNTSTGMPIHAGTSVLVFGRTVGVQLSNGAAAAAGTGDAREEELVGSSPMQALAWTALALKRDGSGQVPFLPLTVTMLDKARDLRFSFDAMSNPTECVGIKVRLLVDGSEAKAFDGGPLELTVKNSTIVHGKNIAVRVIGTCQSGTNLSGSYSLVDKVGPPYKEAVTLSR